jgi:hypothetical protein
MLCLRLRKHLELLKGVTGRGIGGKEAEPAPVASLHLPKCPLNEEGTNCEKNEYN